MSNLYTLTNPGGGSKPDIFEALAQLTKAQFAETKESQEDSSDEYLPVGFAFLAIVFDGKIFTAKVKDGNVELDDCRHGLVRVKYVPPRSYRPTSYIVDVIARHHFSEYLKLLTTAIERVSRTYKDDKDVSEYFGIMDADSQSQTLKE